MGSPPEERHRAGELGRHLVSVVGALGRWLGQQPADEVFDVLRHLGAQVVERGWFVVEDALDGASGAIAWNGTRPVSMR